MATTPPGAPLPARPGPGTAVRPPTPGLVVDDTAHSLTLAGGPRPDAFKASHKTALGPGYWASDLDLVLVEKAPPGVVAVLEVKQPGEPASFAQVVLLNRLLTVAPVYFVYVDDPRRGPFRVVPYLGGDWRPSPPTLITGPPRFLADWHAFRTWETALRRAYALRFAEQTRGDGP